MEFGPHDDVKEQIRQAIDIVDLVGGYLALRRQGRNYVAQCPWHDDTRPSLQVNQERQTFKCWVCDIGGDLFSFVMRMERLEFREALEMLAERAGIELAPATSAKVEPGSPGDKRTQLAAVEWVARELHRYFCEHPDAAAARQYVTERGIDAASIERHQIGFSPDNWTWLVEQAQQGQFSPAVLERVGVLGKSRESQRYYDRFKGRVIFPIRDVRGRPIALGGRILPALADERSAKYVNSPETPLYSKSDQLYALDLARDAIAKSGQAIVMEGYTDVIMAHQHGVPQAVAACGTALGERHLRLLRRFTDRVVLVLDGDEAGQKRTGEVLELFVAHQIDVRILTLPDGSDPCDFLLTHGSAAWQRLMKDAPDALEYQFLQLQRRLGSRPSTHEAAQAVEKLLATLAKVNVRAGEASSTALVREQQVLGRMARHFLVREEELRQRLTALRRSGKTGLRVDSTGESDRVPTTSAEAFSEGFSAWEQEIFELVLSNPTLVGPIIESIPHSAMQSAPALWLYAQCSAFHARHEAVSFDRLLAVASQESEQKWLIDLEEQAQQKQASDAEERLRDVIAAYHRQQEQTLQQQRLAELRQTQSDTAQQEELLSEFFNNLKRRQTGSLSTDG